ncbi:MAG: HIT family protein [Actinomycetota bacterium]|nr:HIT family protein [Actinomycetota bacterium]
MHESRFWTTALNRNQNLLGKLIVVLRRHEESPAELTAEEWGDLRDELRWATGRLREAFAPDHFNYAFLGNQDRHVHLHVIPRYSSPRRVGGADFADPDYPSHYAVPAPQRRVAPELLAAIEATLLTSK